MLLPANFALLPSRRSSDLRPGVEAGVHLGAGVGAAIPFGRRRRTSGEREHEGAAEREGSKGHFSSESGEEIGRVKGRGRSEEHTSELQSRLHLVCRLLLEK